MKNPDGCYYNVVEHVPDSIAFVGVERHIWFLSVAWKIKRDYRFGVCCFASNHKIHKSSCMSSNQFFL